MQAAGSELGTPVLVENEEGVGGLIAAEQFLRAPAEADTSKPSSGLPP